MGHGVRRRMVLGPRACGAEPEIGEVTVRRYRCSRCKAVSTVMPQGMAPRLRYRLGAIVGAIGLWCQGLSSAAVRGRISPFSVVGEEARRGWRSLGRWTRQLAVCVGLSVGRGAHRYAGVVLQRLASKVPFGCGELAVDAVAGAAFIDVRRLCARHSEAPTM